MDCGTGPHRRAERIGGRNEMRKERKKVSRANVAVPRPHLTIEYDRDFPVDAQGFPIPISVESAKTLDIRPVRATIQNAAGLSEEEIQSKLESGW